MSNDTGTENIIETSPEISSLLLAEKKEYRKITDLKEWEKNPRSVTDKDFKRLLKQRILFGQYKPSLITPDNITLGGNQRLKADREISTYTLLQMLSFLNTEYKKPDLLFLYTRIYKKDLPNPEDIVKVITEDFAQKIIDEHKIIWVNIVFPKSESEMFQYALSDNDHVGVTDIDMIIKNMPQLEIDWSDYAINLNNSVLLDSLQKYKPEDIQNEWKGMPEFNQDNLNANKQLIINFKNLDDYYKFSELIQQKITENTRSIWYPAQERESTADKVYEE